MLVVQSPSEGFPQERSPEPFLGGHFIAFALLIILGGEALAVVRILAGLFLARELHDTFCVIVAAVECATPPLGADLGPFTLVLILRDEVKRAFMTSPHFAATPRGKVGGR